MKRELYAKLLVTAFGTQFDNDDTLFVEHTLLVTMAKLIAHVVLGIRITDPATTPGALVIGEAFREARIGGVVDADFFDWILDADGGETWLRSLARRVARFAWKEADHDVLKVLYESIISTDQRHRLGEYYTPDWLAEHVVAEVITDPLSTRCADVSCGSGTFLFHAVRQHLRAADEAGLSNRDALHSAVAHVFGVDVHPVAVTLARVTYLLAIGADRLQAERPAFSVPVYLGDAIQWRHEQSLLSEGQVAIRTGQEGTLFSPTLHFPEHVLTDADAFDRLVEALTTRAASPERKKGEAPPIGGILDGLGIDGADRRLVEETFRVLCQLCDDGRDHIWGYYVRNLVRPVWLAQDAHRVDALIGNPPWLSYRYMTPAMQESFRSLSTERGLWAGKKVATHQDLAALFLVRAVEQYLRPGGRFGYVVPEAVLSRLAYEGFRTGRWTAPKRDVKVAFDPPWSLGRIKPPIFRVPSCVLTGTKGETQTAVPTEAIEWTGRKPRSSATWKEALASITPRDAKIDAVGDVAISEYASSFAQGATLVPRMLVFVEDAPKVGVLGVAGDARRVISRRDPQEKAPWKGLAGLEGSVERRFLRPIHLGRTIVPFRCLSPLTGIIPWEDGRIISRDAKALSRHPGLEAWWQRAEATWTEHRSSERLSLTDRLDYQRGLRIQFPLAEHRILYSASGQYLAAARLSGSDAVIESKLYWAACESEAEALYLAAIFNAPETTARITPLQSRGEHNPRDFHKLVFQLPIPRFAPDDQAHLGLARLGVRAEAVAAAVPLADGRRFESLRRDVREALAADGVLAEIDAAVSTLLGEGS